MNILNGKFRKIIHRKSWNVKNKNTKNTKKLKIGSTWPGRKKPKNKGKRESSP